MACGVPIVSSDIPALRETVGDDCAVLVPPRDVAALREAVAALLDDPDRRAGMSRAARARAADLTLDARARRILTWLEGLVASPRGSHGS